MKLDYLCTYRADLKPLLQIGPGPYGARAIGDITGGVFEGPRMRGKLLPSGADWLLIGADGFSRLDVRLTLATDDGAFIYVTYGGVLELSQRVQSAFAAGGSTEFGEQIFFSTPRFEAGDPRYAWLNRVVAVGEGRVVPSAVEYRVYALTNDASA